MLALAALPPAVFSWPAGAEVDVPRPAECLLQVGDSRVIDGPCSYTPVDEDGSFSISGADKRFFAYVLVSAPGQAEGYWNGTPEAQHAHEPLGRLRRNGACWENPAARVCAW